MINLYFNGEKIFVYSVSDWERLRKVHRIVGSFFGNTQFTCALPVALLPEEALLLVTKKLAKLISYPQLLNAPTESEVDTYNIIESNLFQDELAIYREQRKRDLERIIDKIIEGKKKKSSEHGTREEVLEEELNKSCEITEGSIIWPILYESLISVQGNSKEVPLAKIIEQTTSTRSAVFTDLWEKGYYLTSGIKFGSDFLVYLGDPIAFHAVYIVLCIEDPNAQKHASEIIAFGRLGTSVRKRAVLASLTPNGSVSYLILNWLDT